MRSFEDVRDRVEESLRAVRAQEAFRVEVERLRREAAVVVDQAALAAGAAARAPETARDR